MNDLYDKIYKNILANRIKMVVLDPNGFCNSHCWYCPVKYKKNPEEFIHQMPISQVEQIFKNIKNSVFTSGTKIFNTTNFNEIFLYKHFYDLMNLIVKYNFRTAFYSNGTTLDYDIIDTLYKYRNSIDFIHLNIPTFDREEWKLKTGMSDDMYNKMMHNLYKLHEKADNTFKIYINIHSLSKDDKYNTKFKNAILNTDEEISNNYIKMRLKFQKFKFLSEKNLIDRGGILTEYSVFKSPNVEKLNNEEVCGCSYTTFGNISKLYNVLNINSKGDVFLCCNDFDMKYTIGNILEGPIDKIWKSEKLL